MTIATEDDIQTLKRAEFRIRLTEGLSRLPVDHAFGIILGVIVGIAKRHGVTLDQTIIAIRRTWDLEDE